MLISEAAKLIKSFRHRSLEELVELAYSVGGGLIRPAQRRREILGLLSILEKTKPSRLLEIGTCKGGTLFLFCRVAAENAKIISVDLPGGPFGGGYGEERITLYQSFALPGQQLYLLRRDSHKRDTLEEVKKILSNEKLEFLFIDGDHTYEGVKKDFEMYSPLVSADGLVAFHDIVPGPKHRVGEVPKFWNELKNQFEYDEIVEDWNQSAWGIGLIKMRI
ncbi:class I SAM-dependent methyltransferase [Candidatus Bathyarchaeota archaeon]|nr:class I SAM-dependent methyltransferase [Candidatus Bathyarchaeota archaeon]